MIRQAITALLTVAAVSTISPVPVLSKSQQPVFVGTELSEMNAREARHKNLAFSESALAATPKLDVAEDPPMFEDEDSGLTAVLQQCIRSSEAVNCSVLLTSTTRDLNVTVHNNREWDGLSGRIRIFDPDGNEYSSASVQVGSLRDDIWVRAQLIQGVGIRIVVTFQNVPARVGKVTVLEIPVRHHYDRFVYVRFRSLAISE